MMKCIEQAHHALLCSPTAGGWYLIGVMFCFLIIIWIVSIVTYNAHVT